MVNVLLDRTIFDIRDNGGIRRMWSSLLETMATVAPDITFNGAGDYDLYMTTYYTPPPVGMKSVFIDYDHIQERLPAYRVNWADVANKHACIKSADRVLAISQFTADDCKRYTGVDAEVMYLGVDTDAMKPIATVLDDLVGYGISKPYFVTVGLRYWHKNVQALYQAWNLFKYRDDFQIVAVGGKDVNPPDYAFSQTYPDTWVHVPHADDETLATLYGGAVALVYPSMWEGFGLPVLEAYACGCPVIASNTGSVPEIAGGLANLVDITRPAEIAHELEYLSCLGEPVSLITGLDPSMLRHHARKFTWKKTATRLAEVIREVAQ